MGWSALVTRRYRRRIAVPSFVVLVAIAGVALGRPLFSDFEAHRAGYISGVLRWAKGCGAETSPAAQERLKHYQQRGNAASFTAGFALGRKQLEQTRDATACRLLVAQYVHAAETPLLIALPSELSEVEWPFWLLVLLTGWLLLRSLVSTLRKPRILPSSGAMKNWPRVLSLLCLGVSIAGVAAMVLQFPPAGLESYRRYFWTDTRQETLLPTMLVGFGPLAAFIALYAPLRWIIRRRVRRESSNRIRPPVENVAVQPPQDYAREAAPQADIVAPPYPLGGPARLGEDIVTLNVAGPSAHAGNWHNPHHQGRGPQNMGGPGQSLVRPEEYAVQALAQRLMAAAQLNRAAHEPDVNLSAHPAPIIQPLTGIPAPSEFVAKRDAPPASQVGYPRIRRDLKNRSWRGLLKSIDDDAQGVGRRRR
jgi:hypothetical protein